jgi:hypothetical protein
MRVLAGSLGFVRQLLQKPSIARTPLNTRGSKKTGKFSKLSTWPWQWTSHNSKNPEMLFGAFFSCHFLSKKKISVQTEVLELITGKMKGWYKDVWCNFLLK